MEIKLLADCPDLIPAIACLQQLEMYKVPSNRNLPKAIKKFKLRSINRGILPLTLVAIVDTLPVGSVSLIERELESHPHLTPWIATLFVSSHYSNLGIGKRLMEEIEAIAAKVLGYKEMYLFTDAASHYYERMNWEAVETVHPEGKPVSILMKKAL